MKIDINEVEKSGYTLECILTLLYYEFIRIGKKFPYSTIKNEDAILLCEKGLLKTNVNGYELLPEGKRLVGKILGNIVTKKTTIEGDFKTFWNTFPTNDAHGPWLRTRSLRSNKDRCELLYKRAINNDVSPEDILKALKWDISNRKNTSVSNNKLSFLKNSAAWLLQKEYNIILEELKSTEIDSSTEEGDWTSNML